MPLCFHFLTSLVTCKVVQHRAIRIWLKFAMLSRRGKRKEKLSFGPPIKEPSV